MGLITINDVKFSLLKSHAEKLGGSLDSCYFQEVCNYTIKLYEENEQLKKELEIMTALRDIESSQNTIFEKEKLQLKEAIIDIVEDDIWPEYYHEWLKERNLEALITVDDINQYSIAKQGR